MSAYEVRRIEDLEKIPVADADVNWRPIRRALGIRAFGINAYTADEGTHVVEEHTETQLQHEEVYVVVSGRARFILGDDEVEVAAGAFVFVRDPQSKRGAVALEDGTTVVAIGGKPGEAYVASAWESWFMAAPYRDRGDYERGTRDHRRGSEAASRPSGAALRDRVLRGAARPTRRRDRAPAGVGRARAALRRVGRDGRGLRLARR